MGEAGQRIFDYDGTFFQGVKSDCDPGQLPLGYAWSALNIINLGGVQSTRPGQRCIVTFPDGNLQGGAVYRPQEGLEQMMVVVDGVVYVATFPFVQWVMLPNIQLAPNAKQVYWALTTQSAKRLDESLTSAISVIIPKNVMFIQDGGLSAPAWYDGSGSGQIRGNPLDTPSGGPMEWVGDRLWVAVGNQVFASDISNPFSFREQIYLGGASAFFFASEVTAMNKTPSIEAPQLLVFTESDTSILQANIRSRDQWPTTQNFQEEILQVGCLSNRSVVSHYGSMCWWSSTGVVIYDLATAGKLTSRLPIRDNEMMISKTQLSDDTTLVSAGAFGQFLLMSVPAEDIYNKHTWVLNHASLETLSDSSGPSWCGQWTGTRPVEWIYGEIADQERIYHVSVDTDGKNRLWECFTPDRSDNGCPITWAFTTRAYFGQTCPVPSKLPGQICRLQWCDIGLAGIAEDLDIGVFYAGGARGAFTPILNKKISVAKGSLSFDQTLDMTSIVFGLKPQSRVLRTQDANQQSPDSSLASCGVERTELANVDESFQLLIVGQGAATVRFVRAFALTVPERKSGDGLACTDEETINAVRFDGASATGTDEAAVLAELAQMPTQDFLSSQTVVLEQNGYSAVGAGAAESIISQKAADRVASVIATRQAENELIAVLPDTFSIGLE